MLSKKKMLLPRKKGHRLECVWMHDALERVCLDKTVLDVALTKYFESLWDPDSRQNRYVSFRRREDVPPRWWSDGCFLVDKACVWHFTCTAIRTHAYRSRIHPHTTFFAALRTRKRKHAHTPHGTTLWWPRPHKQIPSHARGLLFASAKLTLENIATRRTVCVSKHRGDGSRLWSPPWLSHVTSNATTIIASQQWPCFKAISVNMLGAQARATMSDDIVSPHPRQPLRESLRAEGSYRHVKKQGNYSPSGLLSEYLTHPVALQRTIVKITGRKRFAPNSNTTKHHHLLFEAGVNTAWPQRFQSCGLSTARVIA